MDGAVQYWTFSPQYSELNETLCYIKQPVSGIMLQQQKTDEYRRPLQTPAAPAPGLASLKAEALMFSEWTEDQA